MPGLRSGNLADDAKAGVEPGVPARPDGPDARSVSQPVCRPSGTRPCSTSFPALTCRAFLCRRFAAGVVACSTFLTVLGVATQTRVARPGRAQLVGELWSQRR